MLWWWCFLRIAFTTGPVSFSDCLIHITIHCLVLWHYIRPYKRTYYRVPMPAARNITPNPHKMCGHRITSETRHCLSIGLRSIQSPTSLFPNKTKHISPSLSQCSECQSGWPQLVDKAHRWVAKLQWSSAGFAFPIGICSLYIPIC